MRFARLTEWMRLSILAAAALSFAAVVTVVGTAGCSVAVVGASVTTLGAAGVLVYSCDGYVLVNARDPVSGQERCNESILAQSADDDERELSTCTWTRLPPGTWKLTRSGGGASRDPVTLVIERTESCEKYAYTIELV